MLQQSAPADNVIATGEQHSVRDLITRSTRMLEMELRWQSNHVKEHAVNANGRVIVAIDPAYFRPTEVATLLGDTRKAQWKLGWAPLV